MRLFPNARRMLSDAVLQLAGASPPAPTPGGLVPVRLSDNATGSTAWCPGGVAVGSWGNPTSGLGIAGFDPTRQLQYGGGRIPSAYTVDQLYTYDWLADRIIELMPSIAMVRGFAVPDDTSGELVRQWQALNYTERFPHGAFERAVNDGRAYGASLLLNGYALGDPTTPLTPEQAAGGINFLDVFGQHELRCLKRWDDPSQGNFGMPELYEVIAASSGPPHPRRGQIFHASRGIRFSGRILRVPNTAMDLVGDFPEIGVSVLTPVLNVIAQYGLAWSAMSNMLQDASIGVMKLAGLVEALASEDKAIIEDRLQVLQRTKSVHRMMFLDADNNEDYTRTEVSLTDVPAVMQQFMVAVAGAAACPARIFFSSSPSGLNANASGNTDLSQFYAGCADYQNRYLGPKLDTVLTAINGGEEVHVEWPSLWESSDNEKAQTRLANANATKVYWDMGAIEATDVVSGAKSGVPPETLGTPDDDRAALDPLQPGEGGPDGAPGSDLAAEFASK
ncbi:MAG: anti-CBASS Acb1 family protein [Pseudomonadota bacterium]